MRMRMYRTDDLESRLQSQAENNKGRMMNKKQNRKQQAKKIKQTAGLIQKLISVFKTEKKKVK